MNSQRSAIFHCLQEGRSRCCQALPSVAPHQKHSYLFLHLTQTDFILTSQIASPPRLSHTLVLCSSVATQTQLLLPPAAPPVRRGPQGPLGGTPLDYLVSETAEEDHRSSRPSSSEGNPTPARLWDQESQGLWPPLVKLSSGTALSLSRQLAPSNLRKGDSQNISRAQKEKE